MLRATTAALSFALVAAPALAGSIEGTATFWGDPGASGDLEVSAHLGMGMEPEDVVELPRAGGPYTLTVPDGSYYLAALLDRDDSDSPPDPDEPLIWYDADDDGFPDTVSVSGTVTGIDLDIGFVYVDADAMGDGDGSSWANAFTSPAGGIDAAVSGIEVWVAEGTYTPGASRTDSFVMKSGVRVYGGFAGGELLRSARSPDEHPTILSGEIGGAGDADNSYHVVRADTSYPNARLDGFTVTRGRADGASPDDQGGGLRARGGSVTLVDVDFVDNKASYYGGGVAATVGGVVHALNCGFYGNQAVTLEGGGYWSGHNGQTIANSVFSGNSAWRGGGLVLSGGSFAVKLVSNSFSGNVTTVDGSAIWLNNSAFGAPTYTASNLVVWDNSGGSDQVLAWDPKPSINYSIIGGDYAGPGSHISTTDPLFVDRDGADDVTGTADDDLRVRITSPAVDAGNNATLPGDPFDIDEDYDDGEVLPIDHDGTERLYDVASVPDTGSGSAPLVDMGAFEIGSAIFADGFESGDASGWSSTVGVLR